MIEVTNLCKKYGNRYAVSNLSFTIESGQIYGFLGPNGAGKSTTMNMMTGYLAPSSGKIIINGINMKDNPEECKKNIGYLPELPPVYMDMTVDEYLKFVAELKKVPRGERAEQLEEVKKLTQIDDVSGRLIKNLSKGYRQRVGLAQAILGYPEVIILDEPMVGLDPKQIIEIRDLIKELGKNHTIILSSHILSEISAICDHIMIISKGQLVAQDSPENLIAAQDKKCTLNLTVKGAEDSCRDVLSAYEDIDISSSFNEEENTTKLTIEVKNGKDLREDLFFAFSDAKLPIIEMTKPESQTLEEVFLNLTSNEIEPITVLKRRRKKETELQEIKSDDAKDEIKEEEVNNDDSDI